MSVKIETSVRGFDRAGHVLGNLSHLNMGKLLDGVGQMIENQTKGRIEQQEGPPDSAIVEVSGRSGGGMAEWGPYTPEYKRWKDRKGLGNAGFLRLYGHLLESIQHIVTGDQVGIGSNVVYAAANQATHPYLGMSKQGEDDVEDLINRWLKKVVGV